jgi:hypothetical protein
MLLRNLSNIFNSEYISYSRHNKINTNYDIVPPNNLDMVLCMKLLT